MVWMLYLSIDHRHGGSEAKLDHHLAVVSCYSRDKKQKDGVEVRKKRENLERKWPPSRLSGLADWLSKKNQEIPQKDELTEFRARFPSMKNITKGRGSGTVCRDVLPLEPEDLNPTSSVFVLTLNTLLNILGFYFPTCKMPIMPSIHCRVLSLLLSGYCAPGTGLIMFCAISFKIYVTLRKWP